MKRKFLAVVLPIVGCATLVGSGFSAWYFGNVAVDGSNAGLTIDVTEEIGSTLKIEIAENSTVKNGTYLILDQGSSVVGDGGYEKKGIMFNADDSLGEIPANQPASLIINATYNDSQLSLDKVAANGLELVATIKISLSETLVQYVDVIQGTNFVVTDTNSPSVEKYTDLTPGKSEGFKTYTYVYRPDLSALTGLHSETWTFTLDVGVDNYENAYLNYLSRVAQAGTYSGGKPESSADLSSMTDALTKDSTAGDHFKIEMSFEMLPVSEGAGA